MSEVELNVKGLEGLLTALGQARPPVARIGILAATPHKGKGKGKAPTNAVIGAAHEFGAPARGLPSRSFLRMPISEKLNKEMEAAGAFTEDTMKAVIKDKSVVPWLRKVAVLAESLVMKAFDSGGFGKWAPWKDPHYTNNANMLLVDTQQLRNSITHEVKS